MAAARRYPLRFYESGNAACSRVRAGLLTGGTDVSTVTKAWSGVAGGNSSVTVLSFVMRGVSPRVERRQKRCEERAAAFRARRRKAIASVSRTKKPARQLAVEEARAASAEFAQELLTFAGLSAEAAPFVPLADSLVVHEAAEVFAERIISRGEDARGVALPTLSTSRPNDVLAGLNAAFSLQRSWRTERAAAHVAKPPAARVDEEAPVAATAAAPTRSDMAPETL